MPTTERPILFSATMIRALLAGTKTQTRRVVKHQGTEMLPTQYPNGCWGWRTNLAHEHGTHRMLDCPYGKPGDRLWVRGEALSEVPRARDSVEEDGAEASVCVDGVSESVWSEKEGCEMSDEPMSIGGPARLGGRRVIASVSGGRDSAALSLHLRELGIEHERVFMDTGWEHRLTYEYLRGPLTAALGPITEIRGAETFTELVNRKGIFPARNKRFCTEELKVKPMQRYLRGLTDGPLFSDAPELVNAVGIRRAESKARSEMPEWEWSEGFDCEVWRPLVAWTSADVAAIHERHGLAPNPLYALGASRVGCWPCIHARKSEIALVASTDPERISGIATQEAALNARALAGPKGDAFIERTMFSFHDGASRHFPLPIYQAVSWAQSKRGEWQPAGAAESCMRHGVCETVAEEPENT